MSVVLFSRFFMKCDHSESGYFQKKMGREPKTAHYRSIAKSQGIALNGKTLTFY